MLKDSRAHYKLMSAQESEFERLARYRRDNLEVVETVTVEGAPNTPITVPTKVAPPTPINDDEIVPMHPVKTAKRSRKVKEASIAA
jgi:hypothetical protein